MKKYMNPRLWVGLRPVKATLDSAKLIFFYGKSFQDQRNFSVKRAVDIMEQDEFDNSKPTVIYIHGYIEHMEIESVKVVCDAYLKRGDHNIIFLDWGELADGNYLLDAVPNAMKLSSVLAEALLEAINNGLDGNKLHIVGHSLGGQLAGNAARKIKEKSSNTIKIHRVTALDPAFPPFYPGFLYKPLGKRDANLVDVIHTDAWLYGAPVSTGSVDFWPNGGKTLQPGCPKRNYKMLSDNDLCSHRRSWWFWAESVKSIEEKKFPAVKCKSYDQFKEGKVDEDAAMGFMGIDCPMNISGDYYLQTNGDEPYCKGINGISYVSKHPKVKT